MENIKKLSEFVNSNKNELFFDLEGEKDNPTKEEIEKLNNQMEEYGKECDKKFKRELIKNIPKQTYFKDELKNILEDINKKFENIKSELAEIKELIKDNYNIS